MIIRCYILNWLVFLLQGILLGLSQTSSFKPTRAPRVSTFIPTYSPTYLSTYEPTTDAPSFQPTTKPTRPPIPQPTRRPRISPTVIPTYEPTFEATNEPIAISSSIPTILPTDEPTIQPIIPQQTYIPSVLPTIATFAPSTPSPTIKATPLPTVSASAGYQIDASWAHFRGNNNLNTGRSIYYGSSVNSTRCKILLDNTVVSSPVIAADGTVYIGTAGGTAATIVNGVTTAAVPNYFYAISSRCILKWRSVAIGVIDANSAAIGASGAVYIGSVDTNFYAFNQSNGVILWQQVLGGEIHSSPVIGSDGTVYIGDFAGNFYALTPSGSVKWKYATSKPTIRATPAITADNIIYVIAYLTADGSTLYALDCSSSGSLKWQRGFVNQIWASPAIGSDGIIYVGSNSFFLNALYPSNGSPKWRIQTSGFIVSSAAIAINGTVYAASYDGFLYAFSTAEGSEKWKYKIGNPLTVTYSMTSSPVIDAAGNIYVGSFDNFLYVIAPQGSLSYRYETGGDIISSAAIAADGTVFVGSNDFSLYAINTPGPTPIPTSIPTLSPSSRSTIQPSAPSIKPSMTPTTSTGQAPTQTPTLASYSPSVSPTEERTSAPTMTTAGYEMDSPWSHYRGSDNLNSGRSIYAGPQTNSMICSIELENIIKSTAVIAADGTIFIGTSDGTIGAAAIPPSTPAVPENPNHFYALTSNCKIKWKSISLGMFNPSSAAIGANNMVYVGSVNKNFYAFNQTDGTIVWQQTLVGEIRASPIIGADGTIYIGSYDGSLYAYSAYGTFKWKTKLGGTIESTPAINSQGDLVACGSNSCYLISDKQSGNATELFSLVGAIDASAPAIGMNDEIYIGSRDGSMNAYNAIGTLMWQFLSNSKISSSAAIDVYGNIYFGSEDSNVYAVNSTGYRLWRFTTDAAIKSSPTIDSSGILYIGSGSVSVFCSLYALNSTTGSLIWQWTSDTVSKDIKSDAAIGADGSLYFGIEDSSFMNFGTLAPVTSSIPSFSPTVADYLKYSSFFVTQTFDGATASTFQSKNGQKVLIATVKYLLNVSFTNVTFISAQDTAVADALSPIPSPSKIPLSNAPVSKAPVSNAPVAVAIHQGRKLSNHKTIIETEADTLNENQGDYLSSSAATAVSINSYDTSKKDDDLFPTKIASTKSSNSFSHRHRSSISSSFELKATAAQVVYTVLFSYQQSGAEPLAKYTELTTALDDAVTSGKFTAVLNMFARQFGVTGLQSALADKVPTYTDVITTAPSFKPTEVPTQANIINGSNGSGLIPTSAIIAIVVSIGISTLIILLCCCFLLVSRIGGGGNSNNKSSGSRFLGLFKSSHNDGSSSPKRKMKSSNQFSLSTFYEYDFDESLQSWTIVRRDPKTSPMVISRSNHSGNGSKVVVKVDGIKTSHTRNLVKIARIKWTDLLISTDDPNDSIIGKGSFGIVFRATLLKQGADVVVKVMKQTGRAKEDDNLFKMAFEECRLMKEAESKMVYKDCIVKVFGIADGTLPDHIADAMNVQSAIGIVMRYEGGGTLTNRIHPRPFSYKSGQIQPTDLESQQQTIEVNGVISGNAGDSNKLRETNALTSSAEKGGDKSSAVGGGENELKTSVGSDVPSNAMSMTEKIRLIAGLARCLMELHSAGIVHGDIKPDNVLLSSDDPPEVRLADFGLARMREDDEIGASSLNETKHTKGTLLYCAPEMMVNPYDTVKIVTAAVAKASRKSDMYAFALVSWEILTGIKPFDDIKNETALAMIVHQGQRPPVNKIPSDCPKKVIDMIQLCWDRDRFMRESAVKCFSKLQYEYSQLVNEYDDVCLSCHKSNLKACELYYQKLMQLGLKVCILGSDVDEEIIQTMIAKSRIVVAFLNVPYQADENCMNELRKARQLNPPKTIIPIFTEALHDEWTDQDLIYLCQLRAEQQKRWDISALVSSAPSPFRETLDADDCDQLIPDAFLPYFLEDSISNSNHTNSHNLNPAQQHASLNEHSPSQLAHNASLRMLLGSSKHTEDSDAQSDVQFLFNNAFLVYIDELYNHLMDLLKRQLDKSIEKIISENDTCNSGPISSSSSNTLGTSNDMVGKSSSCLLKRGNSGDSGNSSKSMFSNNSNNNNNNNNNTNDNNNNINTNNNGGIAIGAVSSAAAKSGLAINLLRFSNHGLPPLPPSALKPLRLTNKSNTIKRATASSINSNTPPGAIAAAATSSASSSSRERVSEDNKDSENSPLPQVAVVLEASTVRPKELIMSKRH